MKQSMAKKDKALEESRKLFDQMVRKLAKMPVQERERIIKSLVVWYQTDGSVRV